MPFNQAGPFPDQRPDERPREVSDQDLPKPASCRLAGLECRPCVQTSAANLASICRNLSASSLRESFLKIYPDQACVPMSRTFRRAYLTAQQQVAQHQAAPTPDDHPADGLEEFLTPSPA